MSALELPAGHHPPNGRPHVTRSERVQERVDCRVDVRHPERDRERVGWNETGTDEADVVDDVEGHPADDVERHDVGERHVRPALLGLA